MSTIKFMSKGRQVLAKYVSPSKDKGFLFHLPTDETELKHFMKFVKRFGDYSLVIEKQMDPGTFMYVVDFLLRSTLIDG